MCSNKEGLNHLRDVLGCASIKLLLQCRGPTIVPLRLTWQMGDLFEQTNTNKYKEVITLLIAQGLLCAYSIRALCSLVL